MRITLLGHSGFLAEGEKTCLVFDYFTDNAGIVKKLPFGRKDVVFFASHAHRDHFNRDIFGFAGRGNVGYVLGEGIPKGGRKDAVVLEKGRSAEMLGVTVNAYGSTDEGVSFLVEAEGVKLFHAGDLNDWYWEEESTEEELRHDEQWFLDELKPLADASPDVAFVPGDARLGRHALRGPMSFARAMKPKRIALMHLTGGYRLPGELRQALIREGLGIEVLELVRPGDTIAI